MLFYRRRQLGVAVSLTFSFFSPSIESQSKRTTLYSIERAPQHNTRWELFFHWIEHVYTIHKTNALRSWLFLATLPLLLLTCAPPPYPPRHRFRLVRSDRRNPCPRRCRHSHNPDSYHWAQIIILWSSNCRETENSRLWRRRRRRCRDEVLRSTGTTGLRRCLSAWIGALRLENWLVSYSSNVIVVLFARLNELVLFSSINLLVNTLLTSYVTTKELIVAP